jgi:hypothetical protein
MPAQFYARERSYEQFFCGDETAIRLEELPAVTLENTGAHSVRCEQVVVSVYALLFGLQLVSFTNATNGVVRKCQLTSFSKAHVDTSAKKCKLCRTGKPEGESPLTYGSFFV